MPQDAAGKHYAGMFEIIRDPESGLSFELLNGTSRTYRYKVTGGGAGGAVIEVPYNFTDTPWMLTHEAIAQGVVPPTIRGDMFEEPVPMSRRRR